MIKKEKKISYVWGQYTSPIIANFEIFFLMDENIFERKWFGFVKRNTDFKNFNWSKFIIEKKSN